MISYVQKLSLLGLQMLINREVLVGCGACERRVAGDGWVCVRVERWLGVCASGETGSVGVCNGWCARARATRAGLV